MRRVFFLVLAVAGSVWVQIQFVELRPLAARDTTGHPPTSERVLILGDSVAAGSGDESRLGIAGRLRQELRTSNVEIVNGGIPGARIADVKRAVLRRAEDVRGSRIVILSIGGNDLYGSRLERLRALLTPDLRMAQVIRRVETLVHFLERTNPDATIILLGLYNPYLHTGAGPLLSEYVRRWDGRLTLRFAGNRRVIVLPIADLLESRQRISPLDSFHPGADGYGAIAERIAGSSVFQPSLP